VSLASELKDSIKNTCPGVYSLVGLDASKTQDGVIVLDAIDSETMDTSNIKEPETCLTSIISHLVAGLNMLGLMIIFQSERDEDKGDTAEVVSVSSVRSSLSKALLNLQFQLGDLNRNVASLIGLYFDISTKKLHAVSFMSSEGTKLKDLIISDLQSVDAELMEQLTMYKATIDLDLKLSSPDFGEYNSVLEQISDHFKTKLDPQNCVVLMGSDSKCVDTDEMVCKTLSENTSRVISFDIYETQKCELKDWKIEERSEESGMIVDLKGTVCVLGVFNRSAEFSCSEILNDISSDLIESIFFRTSQIIHKTGQATKGQPHQISLPARSYLTNKLENVHLFSAYDFSQIETLTENSSCEKTEMRDFIEEITLVSDVRIGESYYSTSKFLVLLSVVFGLLAIFWAILSIS